MKKHEVLKDNLDKSLARSKKVYREYNRKEMPKEQQEKEKKQLRKGAIEAEKRLAGVWNPETNTNEVDTDKRPMFGTYFGGVNFDKNGRIIK